MKLKNISSSVLRFSRVVTAVLAVFLISTSISLYKSKTSPEIWLAVGALALVVIFVSHSNCPALLHALYDHTAFHSDRPT